MARSGWSEAWPWPSRVTRIGEAGASGLPSPGIARPAPCLSRRRLRLAGHDEGLLGGVVVPGAAGRVAGLVDAGRRLLDRRGQRGAVLGERLQDGQPLPDLEDREDGSLREGPIRPAGGRRRARSSPPPVPAGRRRARPRSPGRRRWRRSRGAAVGFAAARRRTRAPAAWRPPVLPPARAGTTRTAHGLPSSRTCTSSARRSSTSRPALSRTTRSRRTRSARAGNTGAGGGSWDLPRQGDPRGEAAERRTRRGRASWATQARQLSWYRLAAASSQA